MYVRVYFLLEYLSTTVLLNLIYLTILFTLQSVTYAHLPTLSFLYLLWISKAVVKTRKRDWGGILNIIIILLNNSLDTIGWSTNIFLLEIWTYGLEFLNRKLWKWKDHLLGQSISILFDGRGNDENDKSDNFPPSTPDALLKREPCWKMWNFISTITSGATAALILVPYFAHFVLWLPYWWSWYLYTSCSLLYMYIDLGCL